MESPSVPLHASRWLAEEVLRLRKLLVDIDKRGIGHNSMCEGGWKGKPCPCGADELQLRINEATQ